MSGDQIASVLYLSLLGAAVAGWFLMQNRSNLGRAAQQAAIWGLIFIGVIGAAGLWSDIRNEVRPQQSLLADDRVEVPRSVDGHYYLTLDVNGVPIDFVVDTGASEIVLSREDAQAVGIDVENLAYLGSANTANGVVQTAAVRLDEVALGPIRDTDVRAVVNSGELYGSLLGMGYLGRFSHIEITGDRLLLTR